jgi:hypothetical protein
MTLRLLSLIAATLVLSNPAAAAERPAIAGKWLVDAGKSDFGANPVPPDLVFEITTQGEDFLVKQTGGGQPELELQFNTAGREVTNQMPGARMTSIHRWDGDALVGELKIAADDGNRMTFKDRITYSADGKVMTMAREISGLTGDGRMTIVMNRQ